MDLDRIRHLQSRGLEVRHVVDIGASNGAWSFEISALLPQARFDLFEPLVDLVPSYRDVVEPLVRARPQFHLHRCALGDRSGRREFLLYPDHPVGSTGLPLSYVPEGAQRIEVETLTLDEAVGREVPGPPQVIKVDTQGCELAVLHGAVETLPHVDLLILETWLTRGYGEETPLFGELVAWLADFHFYVYDFSDGWRDPEGNPVSQDVFFLNARSAASPLGAELARRTAMKAPSRAR